MDKAVTIYPDVKTRISDFIDGFLESTKWQVCDIDKCNTPVAIMSQEEYDRIRGTDYPYQYIIIRMLSHWITAELIYDKSKFGTDSVSSAHNVYRILSRNDTPLYQYCITAQTERHMPESKSLTRMLNDVYYNDYELGLKIGIAIADVINEQNYRDTLTNREEEFNGAPS